MPSERRSMRGRTRSKSRVLQGIRARLLSCEAGCSADNPAIGSHPGGSIPGRRAVMAATPQPGWQASLRGLRAETRPSLVKMWAHKRFGLLLLAIWMLLLLCYYLNTGEWPWPASAEPGGCVPPSRPLLRASPGLRLLPASSPRTRPSEPLGKPFPPQPLHHDLPSPTSPTQNSDPPHPPAFLQKMEVNFTSSKMDCFVMS